MPDWNQIFMLDPQVHFLNHGSFGATPRPVFNTYQEWQRRLERQPVLFLGREIDRHLLTARTALAEFLRVDPLDLVLIPNATHGANIVARSLPLQPGDEVLTSDHEYGACIYAWEFACRQRGARLVKQPLTFPFSSSTSMADEFWQAVNLNTRAIFLSHITSPTALRLPVEEICARARQAGILTVVDAAHAPGQIPLDLTEIGADFTFGNCHKWMLAPKGAAFLHTRREAQPFIQPLIVSWGAGATPETTTGSRFVDLLQWTGTHDPAACLSVPAALEFMRDNDWPAVRAQCRHLLEEALQQMTELTGLPPAVPIDSAFYTQMAVAPLPADTDLVKLKARLYDEFQVEIPMIAWNDRKFARISIQAYNTPQDVEALITGMRALLPQVTLR